MFTFNRNEQIVLLVLCGILIVGIVVRYIDSRDPDRIPNFEVRKSAVEVPPREEADSKEVLIDINRATAKELERLPGIGPQIAGRIVAYREQNGPFARVDDIVHVRGIGPRTLDRLRPHLVVNAP